MSTKVQVVQHRGRRYAIVPLASYRKLLRQAGAANDSVAFDRAKAADSGLRVPAAVVDAMLDDEAHPIRAWRTARGLTQQQLATAAGISKPFLSQVESDLRAAAVPTLRRIGDALGVPIDLLVR
jgi:DNA-binding XRE family transcriptional regulator